MEIIHVTRIPGCTKVPSYWSISSPYFMYYGKPVPPVPGAYKKVPPFGWFTPHYEYFGETITLEEEQSEVVVVPCDNCNPCHTINPNHCKLTLDEKKNVVGILIKLKGPTSSLVTIKEGVNLIHILKDKRIEYLTRSYPTANIFHKANLTRQLSPVNITKFYSIFCPDKSLYKRYKILKIYRQRTCTSERDYLTKQEYPFIFEPEDQILRLTYGWNIFYICHYVLSSYTWDFESCSELLPVQCDKLNFKMFILHEKPEPPSLLQLCYSSLLQYNLTPALDKRQGSLPKTICEEAPPCYDYHLSPDQSPSNSCYPNCYRLSSTFIVNW